MSTSVAEKPKRAPQTAVETLESRSRTYVCYVAIKNVGTKQVDLFLTKAAELAKVPNPHYYSYLGCRYVGYNGTTEQRVALINAMQNLESKMLPGIQRIPAGEALPEGAGSSIRYNNI